MGLSFPRVCPWGTQFCDRREPYKTLQNIYIYHTRDDAAVRPAGSAWIGLDQKEIILLYERLN
jgi:hypothetical protein